MMRHDEDTADLLMVEIKYTTSYNTSTCPHKSSEYIKPQFENSIPQYIKAEQTKETKKKRDMN